MSLQRVSQLYEERPSPGLQATTGPVTITALPATVNLSLYQGDDFYLDLTVTNPDSSPADLTGATATATIKASPTAPDIMATFSATITANVVHLHLPATEAAKLAAAAVWDCQIANPLVTTLAAGKVTTTLQVTL